jgi:hypothetical protein
VERFVETCSLCAEFAGAHRENAFKELCDGLPFASRIVEETPRFVALPAFGQLVEGYMLLCARQHILSIGASLSEPGYTKELTALLLRVQERLRLLYTSRSILFEHGAAEPGGSIGCGTDHAHLHVVPAEIDLLPHIEREDLDWRPIRSLDRLGHLASLGNAYLYYVDVSGQGWVCTVQQSFESQYLRKALARAVGDPQRWDWRQHPMPERVERVLASYR